MRSPFGAVKFAVVAIGAVLCLSSAQGQEAYTQTASAESHMEAASAEFPGGGKDLVDLRGPAFWAAQEAHIRVLKDRVRAHWARLEAR